MNRFYTDTPGSGSAGDAKTIRAQTEARADDRARWDADDNFWKLDTWSEDELADDVRFTHFLANQHLHKRGPNA